METSDYEGGPRSKCCHREVDSGDRVEEKMAEQSKSAAIADEIRVYSQAHGERDE